MHEIRACHTHIYIELDIYSKKMNLVLNITIFFIFFIYRAKRDVYKRTYLWVISDGPS